MGTFGWKEILIVMFIVVLLFGARKLPELARGMGKSIKEFKKATAEGADDDEDEKAEATRNGADKSPKVDTASSKN